jgi:hypothetical protein
MKYPMLFFAFCLLLLSFHTPIPEATSADEQLYPIKENGLWGYINKSGEVVIPARYHSASDFMEGLAAVRQHGLFGFIDSRGEFVIPEQYDFANSFRHGLAKVYLDSKPYFIDRSGKLLFEHQLADIGNFGAHTFNIVTTISGRQGVIDRSGELLVDTIYQSISEFSGGVAIATGANYHSYDRDEDLHEIAVIDSTGRDVVPFGTYQSISEFSNGYATVEIIQKDDDQELQWGVIDTRGNLLFSALRKHFHPDYNQSFSAEGLAVVKIYDVDTDTTTEWSSSRHYDHAGVINTKGEILFEDLNWATITSFQNGRAFVFTIDEDWYLIDSQGQILHRQPIVDILDHWGDTAIPHFQDGKAIVELEEGWGVIDTSGEVIVPPIPMDFNVWDPYRVGSYLMLPTEVADEEGEYEYLIGFWNIDNGLLMEPQYQAIQFLPGEQEIIRVWEDDQIAYIDNAGNYIWKPVSRPVENKPLNIDYMNRGYFYAHSPYEARLAGFGGWGGSENSFRPIGDQETFADNSLSIKVSPEERVNYGEAIQGMKLFLANTSPDTFLFSAQDSRLYLNIQAQDQQGEWRDIEYLPSSWCGNSYHELFLPPQYLWEFTVPVYEGAIQTKLRAVIARTGPSGSDSDQTIYSNEFVGSVNPAQFWRKREYTPNGLMDPYNE